MSKTRKWSRKVKTDSTAPPKDLFTKDAQTIARTMARKSVSPKGIGSGMRMIQYFINRAGKNLPAARRRQLERAKVILQGRRAHGGGRGGARPPPTT
jgi:tRNA(adenine34) deaminase